METRQFEAETMQDALKLVKKEMGKDVVILSTKETQMHGRKKIQITAQAQIQNSNLKQQEIRSPVFPRVESTNKPLVVKNTMETIRAPVTKSGVQPAQSNPDIANIKSELSHLRREIEGLPQLNLNDQMQEIKVLMHSLMNQHRPDHPTSNLNEQLLNVAVRLRTAGVSDAIVSEITQGLNIAKPKSAAGQPLEGEALQEFYLSGAIKHIYKNLKVTGEFKFENQQNIICLVGPTGVGKTTTIAKLAAIAKEHGEVALITMDQTRIGAQEQLSIFAKILGCSFKSATSMQEVESYILRNQNIKTIFIDTAGRSIKSDQSLWELTSLKNSDLPVSFQLVLSANLKQRDLDENILAFRSLHPSGLIFTKIDESWGYGEIVNTSILGRIPISYFATGQSVPQGLESASKERIIERIFQL